MCINNERKETFITCHHGEMGKKTELYHFFIDNLAQLSHSYEMANCLMSQGLLIGDPLIDDSRYRTMIFHSLSRAMEDDKNVVKLFKVLQILKRRDLQIYQNLDMPMSLRKDLEEDSSPVSWNEFLLETVPTLIETVSNFESLKYVLIIMGIIYFRDGLNEEEIAVTELFTKLVKIVIERDHAETFLYVLRCNQPDAFSRICEYMPSHLKDELNCSE